jgi:hypothetical protein
MDRMGQQGWRADRKERVELQYCSGACVKQRSR